MCGKREDVTYKQVDQYNQFTKKKSGDALCV
jgi:hypothetical protein